MGDEHTVVLLTGGTSGIGRAAARKLAARGVSVIVTGRRREKGNSALTDIQEAHPTGSGAFYQVDFADLGDVRQLAADVTTDYDRLDVLVNNAGTGQDTRRLTEDGIEVTFAVNYVAPYLLTNLLVPRLRESAPSRVVNTVTVAKHDSATDMQDADLSNLDAVATGAYDVDPADTPGADDPFDPNRAYVNSKLALLLFTYELAERLAGTGVRAACFHPGLIGSTDIFRNMPLKMRLVYRLAGLAARVVSKRGLETPADAGDTLVHHAMDQDLPDGEGAYFNLRDRTDPGPRAHDANLRDHLWEYTADLTDIPDVDPVE